ncbi:MAG: prephenate dehydratase [Rhodothermales bacterium]
MQIAFQGEIGAFSEEATLALYPSSTPLARVAFEDVFRQVAEGAVDRGVIPIENTLFGSVHVNYDLLRAYDLAIESELYLRVRHNLMALPGTKLSDIRRVMSHPQALGQCQAFLKEHLAHAEAVPAYDTAGAAKMVAAEGNPAEAAIASERAAQEYRLEILARGIESNHQNFTRFLGLVRADAPDRRRPDPALGPIKTSIVYAMRENVPGALFKSLAVFALRDLDLFKIESRPLVGSPGKYLFYLDVGGAETDEPVRQALGHLSEIAAEVRVLGSYRKADIG